MPVPALPTPVPEEVLDLLRERSRADVEGLIAAVALRAVRLGRPPALAVALTDAECELIDEVLLALAERRVRVLLHAGLAEHATPQ